MPLERKRIDQTLPRPTVFRVKDQECQVRQPIHQTFHAQNQVKVTTDLILQIKEEITLTMILETARRTPNLQNNP